MLGARYTLGVDIDTSAIASATRSLALNEAVAASDNSGTVDFSLVSASPEEAAEQISDVVKAC